MSTTADYKIQGLSATTIDFTSNEWARASTSTYCMVPEIAILIYPDSYPDVKAYISSQAELADSQQADIDGLAIALKTYVAPTVVQGVNVQTGLPFTLVSLWDGRSSYLEFYKGFSIAASTDLDGVSDAEITVVCTGESIRESLGHSCIDDALISLESMVRGWCGWRAPQTLGV